MKQKTIAVLMAEIALIAFGVSLSSGLIVLGIDYVFMPCFHSMCAESEVAGGIAITVGVILLIVILAIYLWLNIPSSEDE